MNITVSYEIGKSQIENFEGLVSGVFYSVLEIGRILVREALEQADKVLMESRDRERYRCKGFQKTCIKTKLGAVEYKRRVYVDNAAAEKQHCVHLLDEALDIKRSVWFPRMCVSLRQKRFAVLLTVVRPG